MTHDRTKSIGASDAPAVVCGPQFPTWAEKTGLAEPPNLDDIEAVKRGKQLEAVICEMFSEDSGRKVKHNALAEVTQHSGYSFLTATVDAVQFHPTRGVGLLEIKNVGEYLAAEWEDEPPLKCQIQLAHQLAVNGMLWGSLCALIGGNKLRWFDMDRNEKFINAMIKTEAAFWELVQSKTPPPPDGSIATRDTLRRMYPHEDGEIIALPAEAREWDWDRESLLDEIKRRKAALGEVDNKFRAAMGSATIGVLPSGGRYTLKTTNRKGYAVEATSFRTLRRKA